MDMDANVRQVDKYM